jgi:dTDP-4-dehydrorhamnose reductase
MDADMIAVWGGCGYCASALADDSNHWHVGHTDYYSAPGREITRFSGLIWSAGWPGRKNIDDVEATPHRSKLQNVYEPLEVASRFAEQGKRMLFFSSGCLFDGCHPSGRAWREDDEPNFTSPVYHGDKWEMEKGLRQFGDLITIFRFRLPFDSRHHPRNTLHKLSLMPAVWDKEQSYTWIPDLVRAVRAWEEKRIDGGIWHVVQPGTMNNFEAVRDHLNPGVGRITGGDRPEKTMASPRSAAILGCSKLQAVITMTPVKEAWMLAAKEFKL